MAVSDREAEPDDLVLLPSERTQALVRLVAINVSVVCIGLFLWLVVIDWTLPAFLLLGLSGFALQVGLDDLWMRLWLRFWDRL